LLSTGTSKQDPLASALIQRARKRLPGSADGRPLGEGDGWRAVDIVCTYGAEDRPFEERTSAITIALVLAGTFAYRGERGPWLMSPGALLLGNAGDAFECSHQYGSGDRCLSFQFDSDLFERIAYDAGASDHRLEGGRLPPLRMLSPLAARARLAVAAGHGSGLYSWPSLAVEGIALEIGAAVATIMAGGQRELPTRATRDAGRIARVLRRMESVSAEPVTIADLASAAGLSSYHFLRTFKRVTGVTPHQWLLRARLRDAAMHLVASSRPITEIALDVGFDDLSNFIRSFRAEFGVSPRQYRTALR
jgi:AraC family transcriptional regulator